MRTRREVRIPFGLMLLSWLLMLGIGVMGGLYRPQPSSVPTAPRPSPLAEDRCRHRLHELLAEVREVLPYGVVRPIHPGCLEHVRCPGPGGRLQAADTAKHPLFETIDATLKDCP